MTPELQVALQDGVSCVAEKCLAEVADDEVDGDWEPCHPTVAQWLANGLEQKANQLIPGSCPADCVDAECLAPFAHDACPASDWSLRCGCYVNENYEVITANVKVAEKAPTVECVPPPSFSRCRLVRFDLSFTVIHEITPYAEIYGEHPSTFVFNGDGSKIPAAPCGFVGLQGIDDEDEDCDDEDASYHAGRFVQWQ